MMYTNEEINEYRAGWLETHPDEVLDDATVVNCLNDERAAIIEALITADIEMEDNGSGLFRNILAWGFDGYEKLTHTELWNELNERGLEL